MIEKRPYAQLGTLDIGWLNAHYHFSFSNYFNPDRMGWGNLRVLNDDIIAPGAGFPPHPHKNMEIITFVREGTITHGDNVGNSGEVSAGDVQVMTAGTGIVHSESNTGTIPLKLFQIWIETNHEGHKPSWDTKPFPKEDREGSFVVLASGGTQDIKQGALQIHADTRILGARLLKSSSCEYEFANDTRLGYMVVSSGSLKVGAEILSKGDAAAISKLKKFSVSALEDTEVVLIDTHA